MHGPCWLADRSDRSTGREDRILGNPIKDRMAPSRPLNDIDDSVELTNRVLTRLPASLVDNTRNRAQAGWSTLYAPFPYRVHRAFSSAVASLFFAALLFGCQRVGTSRIPARGRFS